MNNEPEMKEIIQADTKPKAKRSSSGLIALFAVILAVAITATALITFSYTINQFCYVADENSVKLQTIKNLIEEKAYYTPDYDEMIDAALEAYVDSTGDKYAEYYTAEEYAALQEENEGHYVGIGVTVQDAEIQYQGQTITVLEIFRVSKDSPAELGGLSVGDYIYSVTTADGVEYVNDIGRDRATDLIRGEEGTTVELSYLSGSQGAYDEVHVELTRNKVETISVEYRISQTDPSVGVVSIYQFDLTTPAQFCDALDSLKKQNIKNIVIDMRDNGGGDLLSVVACSSYFAEKIGAVIVTAEDKNQERFDYLAIRRVYTGTYAPCSVYDEDIGKYRDFQIVVLVNENTASAAELLTAVLRDYGLATIVGTQTFGKGSMQRLFSLEEYGLEGGLKLTTSHYYPPCGEGYHGIGIVPDVVVELPDGININNISEQEDTQLLRAIQELKNQ